MDTAKVEVAGLEYDRRWMIVDDNWNFITQRRFPRLALLEVELLFEGNKSKRQCIGLKIRYGRQFVKAPITKENKLDNTVR